ncbi:MAG: hypothetical protein ACJAY3_001356 [Neolewinella sp.]
MKFLWVCPNNVSQSSVYAAKTNKCNVVIHSAILNTKVLYTIVYRLNPGSIA